MTTLLLNNNLVKAGILCVLVISYRSFSIFAFKYNVSVGDVMFLVAGCTASFIWWQLSRTEIRIRTYVYFGSILALIGLVGLTLWYPVKMKLTDRGLYNDKVIYRLEEKRQVPIGKGLGIH